jgi:hypothetical protein
MDETKAKMPDVHSPIKYWVSTARRSVRLVTGCNKVDRINPAQIRGRWREFMNKIPKFQDAYKMVCLGKFGYYQLFKKGCPMA